MSRTLQHFFLLLIFCTSLLKSQLATAQGSYSIFPNEEEFAFFGSPNLFEAFGNRLVYFDIEDNEPKLWVSDGTEMGTFTISPEEQTDIKLIASTPERLYFVETRGDNRHFSKLELGSDELDIIYTTTLVIWKQMLWNEAIYFVIDTENGGGSTSNLVKFDLATSTTEILFTADFGSFSGIVGLGGTDTEVYFIASMNEGKMLGKTDGTLANTATFSLLYEDIDENTFQIFMESDGEKMYIFYNPNSEPFNLWVSDGTEVGTNILESYHHPMFGLPTRPFAFLNDQFIFTQRDEEAPANTEIFDLHVTDGTPAGTLNLRGDGSGYFQPRNLTNFDGKIYFSSRNTAGNWLVRSTDGTVDGTTIVIPSFGDLSGGAYLGKYNGGLVVSAKNDDTGTEIYFSDGTLVGTSILSDVVTGSISSSPRQFMQVDDLLFFTASINGIRQLWVYDPMIIACSSLEVTGADITHDLGIGGTATVYVTGGTPPYTYQLDGEMPVSDSTFTDLYPGTYFLTITDTEGCMIEYSFDIEYFIGSVFDNSKIGAMTVFPNPTITGTDVSISLELLKYIPKIELVVTDMVGKTVYRNLITTTSNTFSHSIATQNMSAGTYLLSVLIDGQIAAADKIILQ